MADVDAKIRASVEAFVAELSGLVQEAALEKVSEAIAGAKTTTPSRRRGAPRAAAAAARPQRGSRGGKRTAEEIESQASEITAFVTKNPGSGVEAIAAGLGTSSKELTLPIKKLLSTKALTRKGQKRATKYFPGKAKR